MTKFCYPFKLNLTWTKAAFCHVKSGEQIIGNVNWFLECSNIPKFEGVITTTSCNVTIVVAKCDAWGVCAFSMGISHLHRGMNECFAMVPQLK